MINFVHEYWKAHTRRVLVTNVCWRRSDWSVREIGINPHNLTVDGGAFLLRQDPTGKRSQSRIFSSFDRESHPHVGVARSTPDAFEGDFLKKVKKRLYHPPLDIEKKANTNHLGLC